MTNDPALTGSQAGNCIVQLVEFIWNSVTGHLPVLSRASIDERVSEESRLEKSEHSGCQRSAICAPTTSKRWNGPEIELKFNVLWI